MMKPIPVREWPPAAANWLTLQQAVHLTGKARATVYGWVRREAEQDGILGRESRVIFAPQGGGTVRSVLWVHRSIDARFSLAVALDQQKKFDRQKYAGRSDAAIQRARKMAKWTVAWRWLCDARKGHSPTTRRLARDIVAEARRVEGEGFRISSRSLDTWWQRYSMPAENGLMAGLAGLVYEYGAA